MIEDRNIKRYQNSSALSISLQLNKKIDRIWCVLVSPIWVFFCEKKKMMKWNNKQQTVNEQNVITMKSWNNTKTTWKLKKKVSVN